MNRRGFLATLGAAVGALVAGKVAKALPAPGMTVWKGAAIGPSVTPAFLAKLREHWERATRYAGPWRQPEHSVFDMTGRPIESRRADWSTNDGGSSFYLNDERVSYATYRAADSYFLPRDMHYGCRCRCHAPNGRGGELRDGFEYEHDLPCC